MLDQLPPEILLNIIHKLDNNNTEETFQFLELKICTLLELKKVNRNFYSVIDTLKESWIIIPDKNISDTINESKCDEVIQRTKELITIKKRRNMDIDNLCKKRTSIKTFRWLMDNNIFFSLTNIKTLIVNDRIDVIRLGFFYKEFLDILFDRFYIDYTKGTEIFSITENINPLIVSAENKRLNIIKLLLETSTIGNPFLEQIPSLLDMSIKYNYKALLSYLVVYHYEKVSSYLNPRMISSIIHRIEKSEDILFYLIQTNKIMVDSKIISDLIIKDYNDLFIYCIKLYPEELNNNYKEYIIQSINVDSIVILNHLMIEYGLRIGKNLFSDLFFRKKNYKVKSIENIIENYLYLIKKECPIIRLCIDYSVGNRYIYRLIDEGYSYTNEELHDVLNNDNIELLKYFVKTM